ncbi:PLP-dependent aminotransferase family protein [Meiothermus granaticius]|uniref:2-aminoadipate transaminase n=1 Tax=Meiothermus granaticius NBRC 107808 TaxID=1227551 RepID=A0A399F380_9DEIN|nr:PLP-dependent aminotransferase family protein [Meiothermus granaticius]MCL6527500.1 PLP-dependent aminotransferase family protein [Thermaceae bacterium]RIH91207.1 2-aminoadipate transaminase [Meiothermus granaticius NBRC 107808]GEM85804.1 2-aminoadipate aminotransferase [Meiothermus granaticius NBRC 107808]
MAPHSDAYWEERFSGRARQRIQSSTIRELLKLTRQPGIISFSGGLPAPELFPVEALAAASERILRDKPSEALQYGPTEGYPELRECIAAQQGVEPEEVLIVSGSQQGLDLLGKVFIHPGDQVLVEAPTYMGALQAFNPYEPEYLSVQLGDTGLEMDVLEAALQTRPKFMYALPTFQNPSGWLLDLAQRQQLVELAARYEVPLIEDDAYAALYFNGKPLPTLFELDRARGSNNVIRLSTFSKTLTPGLRVAWVIAPKVVIRKLVQAKQGTDLHTPSFNQMLVYEVAQGGLGPQIERIRAKYQRNRDLMHAALSAHMPVSVRWNRPEGGMFLWLRLPEGMSATELFKRSIEQKVAFVPGLPFHANGGGENTLRLSFSQPTETQIQEGIARLGQAVESLLGMVSS